MNCEVLAKAAQNFLQTQRSFKDFFSHLELHKTTKARIAFFFLYFLSDKQNIRI